jgi:hypothetical protein
MTLLALPTELLSRICKVLGRHYNSDGDLEYHQTDFGALRLTCREIYEKTIYDASVRFGFNYCSRLEEMEIELDQSSLAKLLLVSKTPYLRDRIVTLYVSGNEIHSPDVVYLMTACLDNLCLLSQRPSSNTGGPNGDGTLTVSTQTCRYIHQSRKN